MASVVVVAAGAALAVSVPFVALKELLENRLDSNMKKHLGKRPRCRVSFPDCEVSHEQFAKKGQASSAVKGSSDDEDNTSTISSPPSYKDISQPPSYDVLLIRSSK